jgi:hypothetical protein
VLRIAGMPVLLVHFNLEQGLTALRESASEAVVASGKPAIVGSQQEP